VGLAARGSRILDDGLEQIENADELGIVQQQGRSVMMKSALLALPITLLTLLV
jgi:hypothetical protein